MRGRFTDVDVLVVGAGPTGLLAALDLAERGVSVRIIDKQAAPCDKSNAMVVQPRTLELLTRHRLADELIAAGRKGARAEVVVGGRRTAELAFEAEPIDDSHYPFVLFVSQAVIESSFARRLETLGQEVERSIELVSLLDSGEAAVARLRRADGRKEIVRAKYLLGCDGATSTVRRAAGIDFEAMPYRQDLVVLDAEVACLPRDTIRVVFLERGVVVMFPFDRPPLVRIVATAPRDGVQPVEQLLQALSALAFRLERPRLVSRVQLSHAVAGRYRRRRTLLAGDAAHVHGPTGGQGTDTGLEDAMNVAGKLHLVVVGHAPDVFLDSYERERRALALSLLHVRDRLFSLAASSSPLISCLRNFALSALAPRMLASAEQRARWLRLLWPVIPCGDVGEGGAQQRRAGGTAD